MASARLKTGNKRLTSNQASSNSKQQQPNQPPKQATSKQATETRMSTVEVPAEVPAVVPAEDRIEFIRPTYEKVLDLFYQLKGQSVLCVEDVDRLSGMLGSVEEAIDEHIGWLNKQGYTMGGSYLSYWIDTYNYHENTTKIWAFLDRAYESEVAEAVAANLAAMDARS